VSAGRNVNLNVSNGITTRGNQLNLALPVGGADVTVTAGTGVDPTSLSQFVARYIDGSDLFDAPVLSFMQSLTGSTMTTAQAKQAFDQLPQSQQLQAIQAALAPHYAQVVSTYIDGSSTYDSALETFVGKITGKTNLSATAAKQAFHALSTQLQDVFVDQVVFQEIQTQGTKAKTTGTNDYTAAFAALTTLFPSANPVVPAGQSTRYGDIELYFSRIYTLSGGSISLLAPGGEINVGLAQAPTSFGSTIANKPADQLGIVAEGVGDVNALAYKDFQVNQSRVFAADGGNILVWSTDGNIDAGRGSKTAISVPPPVITVDPNGHLVVTVLPLLTGSGIQAHATTQGKTPGTVYLFAPQGVVNANDAGIVAGNLVIGATAVLGANNITFTGTAIGLPPPTPALGATSLGASSTAAGATSAAQNAFADSARSENKAPLAESALGWIDVFIIGLGNEGCKPEDAECLKREQSTH
jgi:hypothetical protein